MFSHLNDGAINALVTSYFKFANIFFYLRDETIQCKSNATEYFLYPPNIFYQLNFFYCPKISRDAALRLGRAIGKITSLFMLGVVRTVQSSLKGKLLVNYTLHYINYTLRSALLKYF